MTLINPPLQFFQKPLDKRINYTHIVNMTAREVLKILRKDGWYETTQKGSHIQLEHSIKKGKVTVPDHKGDLKHGTLHNILKQAGLN